MKYTMHATQLYLFNWNYDSRWIYWHQVRKFFTEKVEGNYDPLFIH